ncbi:uncharacterized protein LOC127777550 [Oryza glaberrima]|uniref:uncharacterized protein LOC127777550 n=1 Tax=Oryza glaberrima TaxID=4538 RepID=UPI00023E1F92|nr:uncharacterized protein LOC127777550 [Oryza glaberrima]
MEEQLKRPVTMKKISVQKKSPSGKFLHILHASPTGKLSVTNSPEAPAVMMTTPTKHAAAAAAAQSKQLLGSPRVASPSCLCSPTTHAGSFRCRLHRGGGGAAAAAAGLAGSIGCGCGEMDKKPGV